MNTIKLNLPNSEQLAHYRYLRTALSQRPGDVSETDRSAFCDLLLCLSPDEFEAGDIDLLEKFSPKNWAAYCEWEWGTPDEQQELKDEEFENASDLLRGSEVNPNSRWR